MRKRKLLIIVDWFYPGYKAGGPIQSCTNLVLALKNDFEIRVITSDTDHLESEPYKGIEVGKWNYNVIDGVAIYYLSRANKSPQKMLALILETDADYLYLNHMFSPLYVIVPFYYKWRNKFKAKTIVCPRGALFDGAMSIKGYKKRPFLKLFKLFGLDNMVLFHATNELEKKAILSYFPEAKIAIADNLPKLMQLPLKSNVKLRGALRLIYIARIHPIKNLKFLIECLGLIYGKVDFVIIGPVEDEEYWNECEEAIKNLPQNIVINYHGAIPNNSLGEYIDNSHLFALPTKGENFGHSIFECLLAGRPVLISDQTPWRDLMARKIGWDLPCDKKEDWISAIQDAVNWSQEEYDEYTVNAWQFARTFISNPNLKMSYLSMIA